MTPIKPEEPDSSSKIVPISPALSSGRRAKARQLGRRSRTGRDLAVLIVLLGAVTAVLYIIPDFAVPFTETASVTTYEGSPNEPDSVPSTPPFRDLQEQRARTRADATLLTFSELQTEVENDLNSGQWNVTKYQQIVDVANQADVDYGARRFEEANEGYEKATQDLQVFVEDGRQRLLDKITGGFAAIDARDQSTAERELSEALLVSPNNEQALHGLSRAKLLPEVSSAIRESSRAQLRGDLESARSFLERAEEIDSETAGIAELLLALDADIADANFDAILTDGFAALDAKEFDAAERHFRSALQRRPDNEIAQAAVIDINKQRTVHTINTLRGVAEEHESADRLEQALAVYREILDLDGSLSFALAGEKRLSELVSLMKMMTTFLEDPESLSSSERWAQSTNAVQLARPYRGISDLFDSTLQQFEGLLVEYSKPVRVVIESDNLTDVRLSTEGDLGKFNRKEIEMRPGKYLLVGSCDGFRDVRKHVVVKPLMEPVSIRCGQPI